MDKPRNLYDDIPADGEPVETGNPNYVGAGIEDPQTSPLLEEMRKSGAFDAAVRDLSPALDVDMAEWRRETQDIAGALPTTDPKARAQREVERARNQVVALDVLAAGPLDQSYGSGYAPEHYAQIAKYARIALFEAQQTRDQTEQTKAVPRDQATFGGEMARGLMRGFLGTGPEMIGTGIVQWGKSSESEGLEGAGEVLRYAGKEFRKEIPAQSAPQFTDLGVGVSIGAPRVLSPILGPLSMLRFGFDKDATKDQREYFWRDFRQAVGNAIGEGIGTSAAFLLTGAGGRAIAGKIGQWLGGVGAGVAMGHGQMRQRLEEEFAKQGSEPDEALMERYVYTFGTAIGMLEYLTEMRMLRALGPDQKKIVGDLLAKRIAERAAIVGKEAALGMVMEGTTEALQDITEILGTNMAFARPMDWEELRKTGINSFLGGAFPGGVFGTVGGAREAYAAKYEPQKPAGAPPTPAAPTEPDTAEQPPTATLGDGTPEFQPMAARKGRKREPQPGFNPYDAPEPTLLAPESEPVRALRTQLEKVNRKAKLAAVAEEAGFELPDSVLGGTLAQIREAIIDAAKAARGEAAPVAQPVQAPVAEPSFQDVRSLLPRDETGDPDVGKLAEMIQLQTGKPSWASLSPDEKRDVAASFGWQAPAPEVAPAPAEPAASQAPAAPASGAKQAFLDRLDTIKRKKDLVDGAAQIGIKIDKATAKRTLADIRKAIRAKAGNSIAATPSQEVKPQEGERGPDHATARAPVREGEGNVSEGSVPGVRREDGEGQDVESVSQGTGRDGGRDGGEPARADDDAAGPSERDVPGAATEVQPDSARGGRDRQERDPVRDAVAAELAAQEQARIDRRRRNYRITDADEVGKGGAKAKVRANIAAIETLKRIEDEGREATDDERKVLVKYVGWGAFAQDVFADHKPEWAKERQQLKDMLTAEEYASARRSTMNAHYTSPEVIKGIWQALDHLGFTGGRVLEPSAGIGHFIGLQPDHLIGQNEWTAVELDTLTGRMLKALHSGSDVRVQGFQDYKVPDNFFDLAISNVPFEKTGPHDPRYKTPLSLHDYFFVKSLDKVRPGGLVAFVTSSYTLDKVRDRARQMIADRADFVGAIRLPGGSRGAFKANAGTDVTTDVIFLRKRQPGEAPSDTTWLDIQDIRTPEGPTPVNAYYAQNPEMMLGKMRLTGSQWSAGEPVLIGSTENLDQKITEAAQNMPANVFLPRGQGVVTNETLAIDTNTDGIKEGAFYVKDGKIYRKVMGVGQAHKISQADARKVTALIGVRDVVNEMLAKQARGDKTGMGDLRRRLGTAYDAFVKKNGPINKLIVSTSTRTNKAGQPIVTRRMPNFSAFSEDPDAYKVAAIEAYDEESGAARKNAIFFEDVVGSYQTPEITGPADALAVSLNETGKIDIPLMAERLGLSEAEVIADLGNAVYLNPNGDTWERASDYLSGDVVRKLEEAREAASADARYERNVEALEAVQPPPLTQIDIRVNFGAPWIPKEDYQAFLAEALGAYSPQILYSQVSKTWHLGERTSFPQSAQARFGTDRVAVDKIIEAAINGKPIQVKDKLSDGSSVVNDAATQEAQAKVQALLDTFQGNPDAAIEPWVWQDEARAERLEKIYNAAFNRLVKTTYDGSHLTLPGMATSLALSDGRVVPFSLRAHQKNVVWRMISSGNTLLDHAVGSGKTFAMIAGAMELKRLGLVQRPMFVVPNHMLEQFSREFLQAYPGAKLLVATKKQMSKARRKEFAARVAADKWDGIIITHSSFGRIGVSSEAEVAYLESELAELREVLDTAIREDGRKAKTVKEIEKAISKREERMKKLMASERKDEGVTFEELGVDHLIVDEAHAYKNLPVFTKHTRIKGIGTKPSQRATDLFMKIRILEAAKPGRAVTFATGTPMSRSMAELFTMQRYLQLETLKEYGIEQFDAWAATFGRIVTKSELSIDGRGLKETTSFSKFVNIPELVAIYSKVADTMSAADLNLPRPTLAGGKVQIETVDLNDEAEQKVQEIIRGIESLKGVRPVKGAPNHLSYFTKGLQVSTDLRLLDPSAPFDPNGKIGKVLSNVFDIWKNGKKPALAQMIFLDMGVPSARRSAPRAGATTAPPAAIEGIRAKLLDSGAVRRAARPEEDTTPLPSIVNPIDATEDVDEKLRQIAALTAENTPILERITQEIDAALGTQSKVNAKLPTAIAAKAKRPSILRAKPWHDVEHIRDTLRFKTVISSLDQVAQAFAILIKNGIGVVKIDTPKLFEPKEWGWRIVAFDLRMPNGQLIEWYLPIRELEDAKKLIGHHLFENWRNEVVADLSPERYKAYLQDKIASNKVYDDALLAALHRMGYADEAEARASWSSISASLPEILTKFSAESSASNRGAPGEPISNQSPASLRTKPPASLPPTDSRISARPDDLSSDTMGASASDMDATSGKNIGSKDEFVTSDFEDSEELTEDELEDLAVETQLEGAFNLYDDIRERLVARGVPREQIAFIHEAPTDEKKALLFKDVREGKVRIIIGSSGKMGVGTNVQKYLVAMHHVDAPWNPADVEQRDGRILRQGNENKEVSIFRYVTKRSFEAYRWQLLDRKAQFVADFRAGARGVREAEDIDSPLPEASELKAAATGNPYIMEFADLTKEVRDLENAKRAGERSVYQAKRSLESTRADLEQSQKYEAAYAEDAKKVVDLTGKAFKATLNVGPKPGAEVTERKEFGEIVRDYIVEQGRYIYSSTPQSRTVGEISGFPIKLEIRSSGEGLQVQFGIDGAAQYRSSGGYMLMTGEANPVVVAQRIEGLVRGVPILLQQARDRVAKAEADIPRLERQSRPVAFPREARLQEAKARLDEVKKLLNPPKEGDGPAEKAVMAALIGDQSPATGEQQRRVLDDLGFYSQALEAARAWPQKKGTVEQALKYLESQGVKKAEIETTGLAQALEGKTTITRDEIVKVLEDKRVGLKRVVAGQSAVNEIRQALDTAIERLRAAGDDPETLAEWTHIRDEAHGLGASNEDAMNALYSSGAMSFLTEAEQRALQESIDRRPRWSSHTLDPSNPTYAETVLHLPGAESDPRWVALSKQIEAIGAEQYQLGKAWSGADEASRAANDRRAAQLSDEMQRLSSERDTLEREITATQFRTGHFPEPNIVGHMMTSMTRYKGKPVYTLDQIQSDWAQKIRDATREAVAQKLYQKRFEDLLPAERSAVSKEIDAATKRGERPAGVRDEKKIAELETRLKKVAAKHDPALDAWKAFAMRLREGRDPVDWPPTMSDADISSGMRKAENWFASNRITLSPEDRAEFQKLFMALEYGRREVSLVSAELQTAKAASPGHPLVNTTDQWVRTVLRQALRQAAEADAEYIAIPSGKTVLSYNPGKEDGMVGFYDKIVPTALKKIIKGEPIKVETLDSPSGKTGLGKGFTLFPLTPELKARILGEGQPMFAIKDDKAERDAFKARLKAGKTATVKKSVQDGMRGFLQKAPALLPPGSPIGFMKRAKPIGNGLVSVTYELQDGTETSKELEVDFLLGSWAFFDPDSGFIGFHRLAFSPDLVGTLTGQLYHEVLHWLRTNGRLRGATWRRLLDHATRLRVLDMKWRTYMQVRGDPHYVHVTDGRTVGEMYAAAYQHIQDFDKINEYLDQESVAIMLEVHALGIPLSGIEQLSDILMAIDNGSMARGDYSPRSLGVSPEDTMTPGMWTHLAINAWHGSPHDFDRFSMEHIGRGEGAQAFGHGLYFGEAKGTGQRYQDILSKHTVRLRGVENPTRVQQDLLDMLSGVGADDRLMTVAGLRSELKAVVRDSEQAFAMYGHKATQERIAKFKAYQAELEKIADQIEIVPGGHLYEVRLDVDHADLLDWDKPLGEQGDVGRKAALLAGPLGPADDALVMRGHWRASDLIERVRDRGGSKADLSQMLRDAGIPGIRYLDQASRGAGEGTRNIVIFDDSLVEIISKDGKPVSKAERAQVIEQMKGEQSDLDMSPEARKARAEELGFDTRTVYHHTSNSTFDAFDLARGEGALGPSFAKGEAVYQGPHMGQYYLRLRNSLSFNTGFEVTPRELVRHLIDGRYTDFNGDVKPVGLEISPADKKVLAATIEKNGWDADRAQIVRDVLRRHDIDGFEFVHEGMTEAIVFDPSSIRSVNAAFDPAESASSKLMAALGPSGGKPSFGKAIREWLGQRRGETGRRDDIRMPPAMVSRARFDEMAKAIPRKPRAVADVSVIADKSGDYVQYFVVPRGQRSAWAKDGSSLNHLGSFSVTRGQHGGIEVTYATLEDHMQRRGIGSTVYDLIERDFPDATLMPSPWNQLSEAAVAFWSKRAPERLTHQRARAARELGGDLYPERKIAWPAGSLDEGQPMFALGPQQQRPAATAIASGEALREEMEASGMVTEEGAPVLFGLDEVPEIDPEAVESDPGRVDTFVSWWSLEDDAKAVVREITGFDETYAADWIEPHIGLRILNGPDGKPMMAHLDVRDPFSVLIDVPDSATRGRAPVLPPATAGSIQANAIVGGPRLQGARTPRPGPGAEQPLNSIADLVTKFNKALGLTTRVGRLDPRLKAAAGRAGGKLFGQFSTRTGVVRLRLANDFDVLTHEGGHSLETRLGRSLEALKQKHRSEIEPLATTLIGQKLSEGFAEFFRLYITNPTFAQRAAPKFFADFEALLGQQASLLPAKRGVQRTMLDDIADVQSAYENYLIAPSQGRTVRNQVLVHRMGGVRAFLDKVTETGFVRAFTDRAHRLYDYLVASDHSWYMATRKLLDLAEANTGQRIDLRAIDNPGKLFRRLSHTKSWAMADMLRGVMLPGHTDPSGPSLSEALSDAFGGQEVGKWTEAAFKDFGQYLIARRAILLYVRHNSRLARTVQNFVQQNPSLQYLLAKLPAPGGFDLPAPPTAESLLDHLNTVRDLEASHPSYRAAADKVYAFNRNILTLLRHAGLLSDAQYQHYTTAETDWVPFARDMRDEGALQDPLQGPSGMATDLSQVNKRSILGRIKGSSRPIINPIQSLMQYVFEVRLRVATNETVKALADLAAGAGAGPSGFAGAIFEPLPANEARAMQVKVFDALRSAAKDAGMTDIDTDVMLANVETYLDKNAVTTLFTMGQAKEAGEPIVWYWQDGKPIPGRLGDGDLGRLMFLSLTSSGQRSSSFLLKAAAMPAIMVRTGATKWFDFIFANLIRDAFATAANSPFAWPFYTQFQGLREVLTSGKYLHMYEHYAGMMGGELTQAIEDSSIERDIDALRKEGVRVVRVTDFRTFLKAAGQYGRAALQWSEFSETATRVGVFKAAYDRAIADGLPPGEAVYEAAHEAHDIIDFSRHGSKTEVIRRVIPFWNAWLQGTTKYMRALTAQSDQGNAFIKWRNGDPLTRAEQVDLERSMKAWAWTFIGLGTFSLIVAALNAGDDDMDEVSDRVRATHWVIKLQGALHLIPKSWDVFGLAEKGKDIKVRIPKPFEIAWFANAVERAFDGAAKADPKAFQRWLHDFWEITSPPSGVTALDTAYGLRAGEDFFTGRSIVPFWEAQEERPDQFGPYTSETAKRIGKLLNVSPYYVDNVIRGLGASMGRDLTALADRHLFGKEGAPSPRLDEIVIARRFLQNPAKGSRSISEFFDLYRGRGGFSGWFWDTFSEGARSYYAAAKRYKDALDSGRDAQAAEYLATFTDDQKAYALLMSKRGRGAAGYRALHPLENTRIFVEQSNAILKEMLMDGISTGSRKPGAPKKFIDLDPAQKGIIRHELMQARMAAAQNGLRILGVDGWAQRQPLDMGVRLEVVRQASQEVYDELQRRLKKKHFLPFEGVARTWKATRDRLVSDGRNAVLGDLKADAATQ